MPTSKRLESFDLLRLFFVLLALTAHFRVAQGVGYELYKPTATQGLNLVKLPYHITVTRTSMSVLLIVFGFMLEYVYARLWRAKGPLVVLEKMMTRTVICYLAFLALAGLAIYTQGGGTFKTYLGTSLFVYSEDGKAFLFKYYTFLIPVVFLLMWTRFKFGLLTELSVILILVLLAEAVKASGIALPNPFGLLGETFFGIGNKMGPSIIHSLVLVTFGGLAASYTATRKLDVRAYLLIFLALLSVASVGAEIYQLGADQFAILMASTKTYRAHNSHVYFAFGVISFLCFWAVSWLIVWPLGSKVKEWISYYGGNTFIIFLYGNMLLFIFPQVRTDGAAYFVALAIFLSLSLACVNIYDWASKNLRLVMTYNTFIRLVIPKAIHFVLVTLHFMD